MTFKEWWKSKPYWLKAGRISLIILLIVYLIFMANIAEYGCTGFDGPVNKTCTKSEIVLYYFYSLITLPFGNILFFGSFIITLLTVFGIGSIIGLIIGKIKSKKQ